MRREEREESSEMERGKSGIGGRKGERLIGKGRNGTW